MENKYIIDFEPLFLENNMKNDKKIETVIEKVINDSFRDLSDEGLINLDMKNNPLSFKCDLIRDHMLEKFNLLDINATALETQNILDADVSGHSILIIDFDDELYLIDPSYSQFFLKENCNEDKYFINHEKQMVLISPDPGYYYIKNKDNLHIAKKILENGYIKLNKNSVKVYFDSFYKLRRGYSGYLQLYENNIELSGQTYLNSILKQKEKLKIR